MMFYVKGQLASLVPDSQKHEYGLNLETLWIDSVVIELSVFLAPRSHGFINPVVSFVSISPAVHLLD